jgi:hypothetical protein
MLHYRGIPAEKEYTMLHLLPPLAYLATAAVLIHSALRRPLGDWRVPLVIGLVFALFSVVTVLEEGLIQFWINHTTTFAGNQVWFDLLIAVAIAFYLIAPRARAVGMPLLPWALAVIATASIALLPMLARLLWLERRASDGRDGVDLSGPKP